MKTIRSANAPWVLISAGFHEQGGQSKANAALADFLLAHETPVHLVGHDIAPRYLPHPGCTIHRVARPAGADLLGVLRLRRRGRIIARRVCAAVPSARVVVNGGCCSWGDINWLHFVHAAWQPSTKTMPVLSRLKEISARRLFLRHERHALKRARLVIADSEQTRRLAIDHVHLAEHQVKTVYYGSQPSWRPPEHAERTNARAWLGMPDGRPLVVFVGGFGHDERKGFDTLWNAWLQLKRAGNWDVNMVAAGDGRTLAAWRAEVARAGLADSVRLLGFTDRVLDVLAAADLLVSPVRYEPYGLNVQEAICRGVPALTSARAGVTEQYPSELADMILPNPDDAGDLACRLRRWRDHIDHWRGAFQSLSVAMRRRTWDDMAAEIVTQAEALEDRSARRVSRITA